MTRTDAPELLRCHGLRKSFGPIEVLLGIDFGVRPSASQAANRHATGGSGRDWGTIVVAVLLPRGQSR